MATHQASLRRSGSALAEGVMLLAAYAMSWLWLSHAALQSPGGSWVGQVVNVRCPRRFVAGSSRVRSTETEIGPMKKRYSEEQIIGFLREADAGLPVKELCRKHGFSEPSYYAWKAKFGGMKVSDAQRLKALEAENGKLKRLLANSMLEVDAMREVLKGK